MKSNRLYVQCVNDQLIYAIETTSAIIVKTIRFADDYHITLELRNTFTISPCGSLIFTKSAHEDQIKCIRISNEELVGQFRIPISLTTKKYAVTSLCYHPSKDLISCSIFGDTIHSCLFLMCHETAEMSKRHSSVIPSRDDLNWEHDLSTLQQWYTNRSQEITVTDGPNGIALDSILSRIDDLFFMAIQSPHNLSENGQLKDMQMFLQKFPLDSTTTRLDDEPQSQEHSKKDELLESVEFLNKEQFNENFTKPSRMTFQMKSTSNISCSTDTQSIGSRHTFDISKQTNPKVMANTSDRPNSQSDESEPSNRTFEIPK